MSMYLGGVKVKAVKVGQTIEDVATVATLTQAEYNALPAKNSNTLYAITDAGKDNTVRLVENTSATTLPTSANWYSVCYGDGKFVTVAYDQSIAAYSADGINWVKTTLPIAYCVSVCYGNGKFVAITSFKNGANAAYSTDGITWTKALLPTVSKAYWQSVCYGNGKFVAVLSDSTTAAYSTDGITWTKATLPTQASWSSICYGNGKFVTVATNSTVAAYSTDGINWTQTTLPTSTLSNSKNWNSVCYGDGKFVTISYYSKMAAYSTDGINWIQTTVPYVSNWDSICYGNGKFVAVGQSSKTAVYSSDGITWVQTTLPNDNKWQSVCYGNGKFIAVADSSPIAAYSTDGINWVTEVTSRELQNSSGADISENVKNTLGVSTPKAKLVTLTVAGWDSSAKTQSVTVSGILADESKQMIIPMPATASMSAYNDAGIQCTGQAANTLTFTADTVPTEAIQVYVTYQDVISV